MQYTLLVLVTTVISVLSTVLHDTDFAVCSQEGR